MIILVADMVSLNTNNRFPPSPLSLSPEFQVYLNGRNVVVLRASWENTGLTRGLNDIIQRKPTLNKTQQLRLEQKIPLYQSHVLVTFNNK